MCTNDTGIAQTGGISSILACRLYRDNNVSSNYPHQVVMLGFDIHYLIDGLGSNNETSKT